MITDSTTYLGISKAHIPAFEAAVQGSITELFDLSVVLWDAIGKGKRWSFGDADQTIYADTTTEDDCGRKVTFQRLRVDDHSAGWWVVLQWRKPHPKQKGYKEMVDFWFHGNQGDLPKALSWEKFEQDGGYGKEDLHFKGRRRTPADTWSCHAHTLDFRHPLLACLRWAKQELDET